MVYVETRRFGEQCPIIYVFLVIRPAIIRAIVCRSQACAYQLENPCAFDA